MTFNPVGVESRTTCLTNPPTITPAMPQSLSAVYLHLIFSTKNREPWLVDCNLRGETHAFLGGISKQLDCPPVAVGGVADHVHLLARCGRGITQSDWVKELKRVSSRWLKERDGRMAGFAWQGGYGVFSVSPSALEAAEKYIHGQEEHHRNVTFQEEFRKFLQKHRVEWDERHVWD
jgi:putative transposase